MPEIMSAEEYGFNLMKIADEEHDGSVLADRFASCTTSRDSAIIDKCKEAIRNMSTGGLIGEDEAMAILNSVLSDINGEK